MRYFGTAKIENGRLVLPDGFPQPSEGSTYEVHQIGDELLLSLDPLDRQRLERIDQLAQASIHDHRKTLEGLAR